MISWGESLAKRSELESGFWKTSSASGLPTTLTPNYIYLQRRETMLHLLSSTQPLPPTSWSAHQAISAAAVAQSLGRWKPRMDMDESRRSAVCLVDTILFGDCS
jgi:hypothetical protein